MSEKRDGSYKGFDRETFPKILGWSTLLAFTIYLIITIAVFWPAMLNPTSILSTSGGGDDYLSLWSLWWTNHALFGGGGPLYATNMVYYPYGTNLALQTLMPLDGLFTSPLQGISLPLAYNVIVLLGFALSGLFTYFLTLYLTSDKRASFVAGLAFAFSSVNIAHGYAFLDWVSVGFIPLFMLFLILAIKSHRHRYAFGAAVSFVLLNFTGNLEEGVMTLMFVLAFLYFMAFTDSRKAVLNRKSAMSFLEIAAITVVISLPLIIPVVHGIIYDNQLAFAAEGSSLGSSAQWSNDLASFFLPSEFNGLFNGISASYDDNISYGDPWENMAYAGYTVIALSLIGIYYDIKKTALSRTIIWLSPALLFAWISLGPFVVIYGYNTGIPGIYLILSQLPLLNIIREPGRFDIFVALSMAILAAYGLKYLFERMRTKRIRMQVTALAAVVSALIFIECTGLPITGSFINSFYVNGTIPTAYKSAPGSVNGTMLVLPTEPYPGYTYIAMYYQSQFMQPIIGGYTSRVSGPQIFYPFDLPLVANYSPPASNPGNNFGFAGYPIEENYTIANRVMLSSYNVSRIMIVKYLPGNAMPTYNTSTLNSILQEMVALHGKLLYNGTSTELFSVPDAAVPPNNATSLLSGIWVPAAYLVCGSSCPYNYSIWTSLWFTDLNYTDGMTILVPRNESVTVCTEAYPLYNATLYAYKGALLLKSARVQYGANNYSFTLNATAGYNNITLSSTANVFRSISVPDLSIEAGFSSIRVFYNSTSCG